MLLVAALVRSDAILNRPAAARAALNWTVRDLAESSGLHRNTIINIEVGRYAGVSPVDRERAPKSGYRIFRGKHGLRKKGSPNENRA